MSFRVWGGATGARPPKKNIIDIVGEVTKMSGEEGSNEIREMYPFVAAVAAAAGAGAWVGGVMRGWCGACERGVVRACVGWWCRACVRACVGWWCRACVRACVLVACVRACVVVVCACIRARLCRAVRAWLCRAVRACVRGGVVCVRLDCL